MKRRDLMKELRNINPEIEIAEGGAHTRVELGGKLITTVPRHKEVAEFTARQIIRLVREATT